jgi:nucleoside-diphosphate-sugar epimerase
LNHCIKVNYLAHFQALLNTSITTKSNSKMSTGKNVFIIGPGLIGWTVLDLLVAENYKVTGLVRRQEHADGLKESGAEAVIGDLHDEDLIVKNILKNDIVFHTATADDLPSVQAVLRGVREKVSRGDPITYIHTSGTSLLDDKALGSFKSDKIYHDDKQEEIDSLANDAPHRLIDLEILKARKELQGKAKIAIVIPPLIYGTSHGRLTIQLPTLARWALKYGHPAHVGQGKSVWSNVHVRDLARGFVTVLHHLESPQGAEDPNPYFFAENSGDNEPSWGEMVSVIGKALHEQGKIEDPTPREMPVETYGDVFGLEFTGPVVGMNSRSRAVRLRQMGWKPQEKGWKESLLEDELPLLLKEDHSKFQGYAGAVAS